MEFAQPNFIYTKLQATNDPGLSSLWGMLDNGGGANATGAWASGHTDCSDVVVAVIGAHQGVLLALCWLVLQASAIPFRLCMPATTG